MPAGPDPPGDPRPEKRARPETRLQQIQAVSLAVIALFVVLLAVRAMAVLLIPIVLAILLKLLLLPVSRRLARAGVPPPAAAALVMAVLTGVLGLGALRLVGPAQEWMRELPGSLREARRELGAVVRSLEDVQEAAKEVKELTSAVGGDEEPAVRTAERGLLAGAGDVAGSVVVCWFLLLFLLAGHGSFLRALLRMLPSMRDKRTAVEVLRDVEQDVSRYLFTIAMINVALGAAIGCAMALIGLPNPVLWGTMAVLLNFVPYAGSMLGAAVVSFVALVTFGAGAEALLAPASYGVLSGLEGMLITPMIVGRRLRLRPVAVLLGLLFWGWMWGIVGALLSVPFLVLLKILCEHVEALKPIDVALAGDRGDARPAA